MAEKVWKDLEAARQNLVKRAHAMKKAFMEMPGGMPQGDPAAGGMPPDASGAMPPGAMPPGVDPAAMGAMPPGGDPAMGGMPPGVDPAMLAAMGGAPMGVDPATAGMLGGMPPDAGAGAAAAGASPSPEPQITITLSQLWDIVTKVLGLAKKIGANGQGISAEAAPAPAAPAAPQGQDAIKAAVMEALGDMGLTQMKVAQAGQAQRSADMAALRKAMAGAIAKAKRGKVGQTTYWTPDEIAAFQAFTKKHGQPDLNELMNR